MTGLNIVGLVDNWSAIVAIVGPIIGFMCTAMLWLRGYIKTYMKEMETRWDKRSTEMETRHREDIQIIREDIKGMETRHIERMDKSDLHWREMFMYMNNKIDEVKKPS